MDIEFALPPHLQGVVAEPFKASSALPRWFRNLVPDVEEDTEFPVGTAKRCMPIFDAFGAGYIIPLPVAVQVRATEEGDGFSWRTGPEFKAVEEHSPLQVGDALGGKGAHKWVNPWRIRTPEGCSCLFITPVNRPDLPFECFAGVVDTDTYDNTINFPFFWKTYPYDRILDQGEPMIQVIPFRREEWVHRIDYLSEEGAKEIDRAQLRVRAKNHQYKTEVHHKKTW